MKTIEIEEDGLATVKFNGIEITIDIYDWYNRIASIKDDQEQSWNDALRKLMEPEFGVVSNRVAVVFSDRILDLMREFKKKDELASSHSPSAE